MAKVRIVHRSPKGEAEIPTEVIADNIVKMAEGVRRLRTGRLNDTALILLIQHAAPRDLPKRDIQAVLDGIEALEKTYLRKKT